jgi:hypothetical protein
MDGILSWLIVASTAILSLRLYFVGLHRRYRAFFFYLIFSTLTGGILALLVPTGKMYYRIWILTEPVHWLLYSLVVLEVYALVLQDYKGLATVGRWALIAAVAVALLASGLTLLAPSHYSTQGPLLTYYYVAERAVYFSLVVFQVTILAILMQYPITLSRNTIVHSIVFTIYFLTVTALYLVLSMFGFETIRMVRYAFEAVTLLALAAWILMLNQAGERRKQSLRPTWMPGQEAELVSQLSHLNDMLLRTGRK